MQVLSTSSPPATAVELRRWVLAGGDDLRDLRASLHRALTGHVLVDGAALDDIPERVVLVATELATNALRHGCPPTIVRLLSTDDRFILEVADHDPSTIPHLVDNRPSSPGGRGLRLAEAFSLGVGWYSSSDMKHIWASFPHG